MKFFSVELHFHLLIPPWFRLCRVQVFLGMNMYCYSGVDSTLVFISNDFTEASSFFFSVSR